jgi:undecaprenyl diphosphate synthase
VLGPVVRPQHILEHELGIGGFPEQEVRNPPLDFIIRTSGERRISNFLLWEAAYAELVFQDVLWPDYGPEHLKAAIAEFHTRERRYGGVSNDVLAAG